MAKLKPHIHVFIKKLTRNLIFGALIIGFSLLIGMMGYHYLGPMAWIDAFENAAMILSGMGPVAVLSSNTAKIFAGFYAIFSGVIFLVVIGITFAPVVHRYFLKFHMEDESKK